METFISIIIIFGLLVAIHEYGHLIFAKRAGILCREFAIGFGPKLFSFKKNETVYTVRLLPIGGFVRMAGEDPEIIEVKPGHRIGLLFNRNGDVNKLIINNKQKYPEAKTVTVEQADLEKDLYIKGYENEDEPLQTFTVDNKADFVMDEREVQIAPLDRQFGSKSVWARTKAIFAGPLMNFALAFVILVLYGLFNGVPSDEPRLGELIEGEPAIKAGLEQGDRVLAMNGKPIESWEEIVKTIRENPGKQLTFKIERDGNTTKVQATPKVAKTEDGKRYGLIGANVYTENSVLASFQFGAEQTAYMTEWIFIALGKLITGQYGVDDLAGPVGIYDMTDQVASDGIYALMKWAALLSINVGIFNLLPLPALDGGRLMFLGVEAVRGKPIEPQREALVHFVGFALLMVLMIVVTWNDIHRIFNQ